MDFDLSEEEYVQKCLEQYRKNKALAEEKMKLRESYITRNKFLNELMAESKKVVNDLSTGRGWGRPSSQTLYEAVKGVIRVSVGLKTLLNLRPEDIPQARAIANKVFDIVREERR